MFSKLNCIILQYQIGRTFRIMRTVNWELKKDQQWKQNGWDKAREPMKLLVDINLWLLLIIIIIFLLLFFFAVSESVW